MSYVKFTKTSYLVIINIIETILYKKNSAFAELFKDYKFIHQSMNLLDLA